MYDVSHDPLQLDSIYKNSRYFPIRKFLLKKLKDLVECKGPPCNTEIGKPPKVLLKSKKHPQRPAPPPAPIAP
jgi:hypothetical protein